MHDKAASIDRSILDRAPQKLPLNEWSTDEFPAQKSVASPCPAEQNMAKTAFSFHCALTAESFVLISSARLLLVPHPCWCTVGLENRYFRKNHQGTAKDNHRDRSLAALLTRRSTSSRREM
jgi:hypothetical protein